MDHFLEPANVSCTSKVQYIYMNISDRGVLQ